MKFFGRLGLATAALAMLLGAGVSAIPAGAQMYGGHQVPTYSTWQTQWDAYKYDHHHVMLGTVAGFKPYRLTVARHNGMMQTVDLKKGTVIFPTGTTPSTGQRVALVGYYSSGTFVVNRVILRP